MMSETDLIPVLSLENAWARLSTNPEYQRCVTKYFKAPTFYIRCSGLYAGTSNSGRRAVYCDLTSSKRISHELATLVGALLETQPSLPDPTTERAHDIQVLDLQSEDDVKALFKDFKRLARAQKQGRQLSAAQLLLLNARRWTAPFQWVPPAVLAVGATSTAAEGQTPSSAGVAAAAAAAAATAAQVSLAGTGAGGPEGLLPGALRSHPVSEVPWFDTDDEGGEAPSRVHAMNIRCSGAACAGACGGGQAGSPVHGTIASSVAVADITGGAAASGATIRAGTPAAPTLRPLRTAPGADAWVASETPTPTPFRPPDAFGADSEGCSSFTNSASMTPVWGPGTPRSALPLAGAAASVLGNYPADSVTCAVGDGVRQLPPASAPRAGVGRRSPRASGCGEGGAEGVLVVCCCVDLEWWERDNSKVTEVGWTMWDNLTRKLESRHHIVAEHEALLNRIHVPNHKHDFLFGSSTTGSLAAGAAALQDDLDRYGERVWARWGTTATGQRQQQQQQQAMGQQLQQEEEEEKGAGQGVAADGCGSWAVAPSNGDRGGGGGVSSADATAGAAADAPAGAADCYLQSLRPNPRVQVVVVGHGLSGDLRALSTLLGVTLPPGAAILDTADLAWAALGGAPGQEKTAVGLRVLLKALGIQANKLHNGGNDARYTMEAMLALVAVEPGLAEQQAFRIGSPASA